MRTPEINRIFQRIEPLLNTRAEPTNPLTNPGEEDRWAQLSKHYMMPEFAYCFVFTGNDRTEGVLEIYVRTQLQGVQGLRAVPVVTDWHDKNRLWFVKTATGLDAFVEYLDDYREPLYVLGEPMITIDLDMNVVSKG